MLFRSDGPGRDEIQGAAADLGGSTIEAWLRGDSIDITDLPSTGATQNYDATSGVLTVANVASGTTLTVTLPTGLAYGFQLAPDEAGSGTLVTVACFASGTRLRTPSGDVPVEELSVGDTLLTVSGVGRPVHWIGACAPLVVTGPKVDAARLLIASLATSAARRHRAVTR